MRITRRFTKDNQSPYEQIEFRNATSEIRNPDGSTVFELKDFKVPAHWSAVACDIIAQKYFRKAGVPAHLKPVEENTVPSWLWRQVPDEEALSELAQENAGALGVSAPLLSSTLSVPFQIPWLVKQPDAKA